MLKRTWIHAVNIGTETVIFEIPEWQPGTWIERSKWTIPAQERAYLHPGFRCRVTVNIDAEKPEQLQISDWGLH